MTKLLIVEDDRWILAWLKMYMEGQDFEIDTLESWENASEQIVSWWYDLVTLDINLPWKDWIEICKEVRKTSNIPIIMLTAKNDEFDRILGLEIWADDYMTKPFSPRELVARIKTILRRADNSEIKKDTPTRFEYMWLDINLDDHSIFKNWDKISLTKSEFDIFIFLYNNRWKIVSRDTLMKEIIWYDQYIFDRTIDTHIKNIRKKLENRDIIETIRGEWYKVN